MDRAQVRAAVIASHLTSATPTTIPQHCSNLYPKGLLHDQVAIITGSGQGIGAKCAELFAKEGAKVVVTDIDSVKSDSVAHFIVSSGGIASSFPGDITNPDFPQKIVEHTIKTFGKINILVNNAGYTWDGVVHKMTDKQWNAILEVHNTAPFRLIRAAAPYLREPAKEEIDKGLPRQSRSIVNISSVSGTHGNPGQANYSTAKMGIVGLTKTIAKEWGFLGIRCNAIAFGTVKTRLTAAQTKESVIDVDGEKVRLGIPSAVLDAAPKNQLRIGEVEEAAGSILMLCSPFASYVSGQTLEVTGGSHL